MATSTISKPKVIDTHDSALKQYIDASGKLPDDVLLGRIVLFTITDEAVAHDDLETWFDDLALDKRLLPAKIKEVDAFKKATSSIDGDKYSLSAGTTAHMLCRDVTSNNDFVRRQITREVQDSKKKRLYYNAAIEATYYRPGAGGSGRLKLQINRDEILAEELDHLRQVTDNISESFARYANYHDGQKLRGVVRNYLKHLNAIEVKGGVYFIHMSKDAELSALCELVNRFGGGCQMKTLPIVDLDEEREFITAVFEREAAQALQEITRDVRSAMDTGITGAAYAKLKERYDEVLEKAQEHMVNLQVTQDITAASAEVALDALAKLQEKMAA
jgi:hypothetical protein